MRYVSTRGAAPPVGFADVLLAGLAPDGGLYVPEQVPALPPTWREGPALGYAATAADVMWPFVAGDLDRAVWERLVADAYRGFGHPDVVPVRELEPDLYLAELFWGPTLAFKDVALQLVGRLFDHELTRRDERVTVVGATSGDTGSAAIEALRSRPSVDCVILHPRGRVSEVQRRQMTTVLDDNIWNLAVEGTFDDCQDLVKAMFADEPFREAMRLSAVNSINWARVMAQVVYYVTSAAALGASAERPVTFVVPTGNFGNVYAGHVARRMGLPVRRLIVASNRNDILTRFFETATLQAEPVVPTLSPSMDIQVSSNFERLLWEVSGGDGEAVSLLLARFRAEGTAALDEGRFGLLTEGFGAHRTDDEATLATIRTVYERYGILVDPHTAVGLAGVLDRPRVGPVVVLATAHPAKFPDAVEQATGVRPPLPPALADLLERPERLDAVPDDLAAVESFVRAHARTAGA